MPTGRARELCESLGDWLIALGVAAWGEYELWVDAFTGSRFPGSRAMQGVFLLLVSFPLAWRRRAPVGALAVFAVVAVAWIDVFYGARSQPPFALFVGLIILVYSASAHTSGRRTRAVLVIVGGLVANDLVSLLAGRKAVGNVAPGLVFLVAAYVVGAGLRRRQLTAARAERRASTLEDERAHHARIAVADERARIARELHDVVAHSVSVMVVQAGAGERLINRDPDGARRALLVIREAGGEALEELGRMLGLLRESPTPDAVAPQPGLDRLGALIEQAGGTGLNVNYRVQGHPRGVPPGVGLAAYRIVQEALTNVRKHADGSQVDVTVEYSPHELGVRVSNDGKTAAEGNGRGHGLIGMRERVTLYGGTLEAGPRPSGGFGITACIPLNSPAA